MGPVTYVSPGVQRARERLEKLRTAVASPTDPPSSIRDNLHNRRFDPRAGDIALARLCGFTQAQIGEWYDLSHGRIGQLERSGRLALTYVAMGVLASIRRGEPKEIETAVHEALGRSKETGRILVSCSEKTGVEFDVWLVDGWRCTQCGAFLNDLIYEAALRFPREDAST